jgi:putative hemolysin
VNALLWLLLALVACLTAAGTAVRSVSRIWLRHWVEHRLGGSPVATAYLERPQRLLLASGAGVALTVFCGGAILGAEHLGARGRPWWALALRVAFGALLVLLVGQTLPRALARRWSARLIPVLIPTLRLVDFLLAPVRWLTQALVHPIERRVVDPEVEARDNIEELLREGELEGVGGRDEIAIITGVVQFGEKTAADVMTPRDQVFAIDVDTPADELARRVAQAEYSRIPLYRGTLDHVVGMVHAFDVLKAEGGPVAPRPVAETPAARPCNDLLFYMLRSRLHLAVVRDEQGATAGIVSLEDLLEELVGDIRDEHDEPSGDTHGSAHVGSLRAGDHPADLPAAAATPRLSPDRTPRADGPASA